MPHQNKENDHLVSTFDMLFRPNGIWITEEKKYQGITNGEWGIHQMIILFDKKRN